MLDSPLPENRFPRRVRVAQLAVTAVTLFLLGAHVFKWGVVRVDTTALWLVGLLVATPLLEVIRKIKVGDFEAEIAPAEIAEAKARVVAALPPPANEMSAADSSSETEELAYRLLEEDPRLALARLRIQIEESLIQLYRSNLGKELDRRRLPLTKVLAELVKEGGVSSGLVSGIQSVVALANRAVHGERISKESARQIIEIGLPLVEEIRDEYLQRLSRPRESNPVSSVEVERFAAQLYRVETIVPLVDRPVRNCYVLDQEDLAAWLRGYEEHAEFIIRLEPQTETLANRVH
jgi:hypothetical protein